MSRNSGTGNCSWASMKPMVPLRICMCILRHENECNGARVPGVRSTRPAQQPRTTNEDDMTDIKDARILILAANGFEQLELTVPRDELRKAGARVDVATPDGKPVRGWNKTDWGEKAEADL